MAEGRSYGRVWESCVTQYAQALTSMVDKNWPLEDYPHRVTNLYSIEREAVHSRRGGSAGDALAEFRRAALAEAEDIRKRNTEG